MNLDIDLFAISGKMFVDRIVENFVNEMVQPAFIRVADIHPGTFPDRFQAFELVDLGSVVLLRFINP